MTIRDWPEGERPREKLLQCGAQALSEAELLAILLRTGTRGLSAVDIARALLTDFGSLRGLLTADRDRVCQAHGLGPARYVALQAAVELARRHYRELMMTGSALANPRATREFLRMQLREGTIWAMPNDFGHVLEENFRLGLSMVSELCARGIAQGAFLEDDPARMAKTLTAIHQVQLAHWVESGFAEPSEHLIERLRALFRRAYCVRHL